WTLAETQVPQSEINQSLLTSAATNRVLRLKNSPSYIEFPPHVFDHLTEATVEAWVKWDRIKQTHFFAYGDFPPPKMFYVGTRGDPIGKADDLSVGIINGFEDRHYVKLAHGVTAGSWRHVAAVASSRGMKLYLDGQLVASNSDPIGFFGAKNGNTL